MLRAIALSFQCWAVSLLKMNVSYGWGGNDFNLLIILSSGNWPKIYIIFSLRRKLTEGYLQLGKTDASCTLQFLMKRSQLAVVQILENI